MNLVTRLRKIAGHELDHPAAEAADEIASQNEELAAVREALAEFTSESAAVMAQRATEEIKRLRQLMGDRCAGLIAEVERLRARLEQLLSVPGDHMTACDKTMGSSHACTCGAIAARAALVKIEALRESKS